MASPLPKLQAHKLSDQPPGWPRNRRSFRIGGPMTGTEVPEYSQPMLQSRPYQDKRYPGDIAQSLPPPPEPIQPMAAVPVKIKASTVTITKTKKGA